jgi:hypothetical protein
MPGQCGLRSHHATVGATAVGEPPVFVVTPRVCGAPSPVTVRLR